MFQHRIEIIPVLSKQILPEDFVDSSSLSMKNHSEGNAYQKPSSPETITCPYRRSQKNALGAIWNDPQVLHLFLNVMTVLFHENGLLLSASSGTLFFNLCRLRVFESLPCHEQEASDVVAR